MNSWPCSKRSSKVDGPVFETKNFRREWIKACVKCGLGAKTGKAWHNTRVLSRMIFVAPPSATSLMLE